MKILYYLYSVQNTLYFLFYLKIFEQSPEINKEISTYTLQNYKNKQIDEVKQSLNEKNAKYVVFGEGNIVINQYPSKNTKLNTKEWEKKKQIICLNR